MKGITLVLYCRKMLMFFRQITITDLGRCNGGRRQAPLSGVRRPAPAILIAGVPALLELGPLSNDFSQAFDDVFSVVSEDLA